MLVFVLVCITLCPFSFCNHLDEEEGADLDVLLLQMPCSSSSQFVIVEFPDHTHLRFEGSVATADRCRLVRSLY